MQLPSTTKRFSGLLPAMVDFGEFMINKDNQEDDVIQPHPTLPVGSPPVLIMIYEQLSPCFSCEKDSPFSEVLVILAASIIDNRAAAF